MRALVLLLVLLTAGCAAPASSPDAGGEAAWSLTATDGSVVRADDPANATVLFFMATWCGTCRSKAPLLANAQDDYAAKGVRFVSVGFDPRETPAELDAWKARYGHDWPHALDAQLRVQRAYGVTSQSSVVVLGPDGTLIEQWGYGAVSDAGLRAALDRALAA